MASVAHATTKARKTNQMTASSQRSAVEKPLRSELSFLSAASAGRRPGSDPSAESGSIVMPAHSASTSAQTRVFDALWTRLKALAPRASTSFCRAGSWTWRTPAADSSPEARGDRGVDELRDQPIGCLPLCLLRADSQRRHAGRSARPATDQVRASDQSQDRKGARSHGADKLLALADEVIE